jgi:hypothetical protein
VCETYRLALNWWPDLLHIYTTCYYISQTTIWHTVSSLRHHIRLPPQETPSILCCNCQLSHCHLFSIIFAELNSRPTPHSGNLGTQLTLLNLTLYMDPTENTVSNNTPIVVIFTDPLLRNGFFYRCVRVYFRGNLFTEPLRSNELIRVSGVISQYCRIWGSRNGGYEVLYGHNTLKINWQAELLCLLPASRWFLTWFNLRPWRWRWNFPRNVCLFSTDYTASYLRKYNSSYLILYIWIESYVIPGSRFKLVTSWIWSKSEKGSSAITRIQLLHSRIVTNIMLLDIIHRPVFI